MAFALSNKLKTHIREVHQKDQLEMKKCDMCDKAYVRKAELDVHIDTVHKQLKNYQCPQCGKWYGRSEHLRRHMKTIHDMPMPANRGFSHTNVPDHPQGPLSIQEMGDHQSPIPNQMPNNILNFNK